MNRVRIQNLGGADHARNIQVAVGAPRRTDADGFIRKTHMQRMPVGLGVHSDSFNSEFLAGEDDSQRNFTAIRDEYFSEHLLLASGLNAAGWRRVSLRIPPAGRSLPEYSRSPRPLPLQFHS